jgi:Hydantoinase/oxoprolinase N-terminal region
MDDSPVHVGVSLGPERSHAVVVRGRSVLTALSSADADPVALLGRAVGACPVPPAGVIVDVSGLLMQRVLLRPAELSSVAMIRIVPRAASDPALGRHPADVVERLITRRYTIPGGHDLFGHELRPLDRAGVRSVCDAIQRDPARHISIVAAGSPAQPRHEREVADALQSAMPDAVISVAYEFGGQGLVAREATAVLNSALFAAMAEILDICDAEVRRIAPDTPFHVARGDGGWSSESRMRSLPVVAIGAADALPLLGAAHLAGARDCRVLLSGVPEPVVGDVRHGLVAVRPQAPRGLDTVLVVPTAVLTHADSVTEEYAGDLPLVVPDRDVGELTCVGAAVSRPTAWLDEIAFIESTAQLERVRADAEARATAIALANGAAPGSADIVEVSTVAMPYSPSGTVRVRVRIAGTSDTPTPAYT